MEQGVKFYVSTQKTHQLVATVGVALALMKFGGVGG